MSRDRSGLPLAGRRTVRRRRPRPVVWLAMGVGKVLLGVAPVVGVGVWLGTAPVFDLKPDIGVETGARVSEEWVRDRLADLVGRNLPMLSLERTAVRLENEWVREAKLMKRLPNELDVQIVEHQPAAVFESGGRSWIIDGDGRAILGCDRAADLCGGSGVRVAENALIRVSIQSALLGERVGESPASNAGVTGLAARDVSGEVLARTLKRAVDVASEVRSFDWGHDVFAVGVLSDDDYQLARTGRPATVLVRGSDLTAKGSVFELLQAAIREHSDPEVVDLRFRDRIVLSTEAPRAGRGPADGLNAGDPS